MSHDNQPFIEGQLDLRDQLAESQEPAREAMNADEVINMIADTLAEADGEFIEGIAKRVLAHKITYLDNLDLFMVVEPTMENL